MSDPDRIGPFLAKLEALWRLYPEYRFGQLVMNLTRGENNAIQDPWNWEEQAWMEKIEAYPRRVGQGRLRAWVWRCEGPHPNGEPRLVPRDEQCPACGAVAQEEPRDMSRGEKQTREPWFAARERLRAWLDDVQLSARLGTPHYKNPGDLKNDLRTLVEGEDWLVRQLDGLIVDAETVAHTTGLAISRAIVSNLRDARRQIAAEAANLTQEEE